jgi:Fic family protein
MDIDRFPFLTFDFSVQQLTADMWFSLGEAMSKCQHLAGVPLKPSAARELSSVYLARGVGATTAIEGNTLSTEEVQMIVDEGSANVPESRTYLEREVQNVLATIRDLDDALHLGNQLPIDAARMCKLNTQILQGIPDKPEVVPGVLREHDVAVGSYLAPHWSDVPDLVTRFVAWLTTMRGEVSRSSRVEDRFVNAILSAVLAHIYIAWIHPFGNGNGRLARLIEVQVLSESGIVPLVATNLLSDHYNKTRNAYYLALDEAQRDVGAFVRYALRGFLDELREQIAVVRKENLLIHWESYVYERFRPLPNSETRDRQRDVALTLEAGQEVTPDQVIELTPSLARRYARVGDRTPVRDLNDLVKMGLVEKRPKRRYRARREVIEAFIPPTSN